MTAYSRTLPADYLLVSIANQHLQLIQGGRVCAEYKVSTALKGPGEMLGSEQTPCGWHRIQAQIGDGCEAGTVFVGRRPTGEVYSDQLAHQYPQRDWILTRILWLSGMEPGRNRFGDVDSMRRFIYIHGCPDSEPMGEPRSHGCVRMRNADVMELFQHVTPGLPVLIEE